MNNTLRSIILFSVLCLLLSSLSSCSGERQYEEYVKTGITPYTLPASDYVSSFNVNIYSVSDSELTCTETTIELYSDMSPITALMGTLFAQNDLSETLAKGIQFEDVFIASDVCCVFLKGKFPEDIRDFIRLEAVLAATMRDFCGITALCIYFNGDAIAYNGKPLGAATIFEETLDAYVTRRLEGFEAEVSSSAASMFATSVVYYVPDFKEGLLRASVESIGGLAENTSTGSRVKLLLQNELQKITNAYNTTVGKPTEDFCELTVGSVKKQGAGHKAVIDVVNADVVDKQVLAAAVTLTLSGNIPGLATVEFRFDDETSLIRKIEDCISYVGTEVSTYYPMHKNSTLERKSQLIPSSDCYDVDAIMHAMLSGASGTYFPKDLNVHMISAYITDGVAVVQFDEKARSRMSEEFIDTDKYYDSPEIRESLFIYSIVNTLTELPNVNSVLLLSGSEPMESFHNIYLERPLYRNPGLIAE